MKSQLYDKKNHKEFYDELKASAGSCTLFCQTLAETLHHYKCHANHTDGCDWFYYDWSKDQIGWARLRYFEIACMLERRFIIQNLQAFMEIMNKITTFETGKEV